MRQPPPAQSGVTPRRSSAPRGLLAFLVLLLVAIVLVVVAESTRPDSDGSPIGANDAAPSRSDTGLAPAVPPLDEPPATTSSEPSGDPQAPKPIGIHIPAIAVDAEMVALGLEADGSIEVPSDFAQTGWWADGPEPGESGPAVVYGHVDSRSGPAVFHALTDLRPGDEIIIDRVDGSSVAYRIDRIERHPKDAFPTEAVYGDTADPELRLVTCGGDFDRAARSYRDNIVVFATLA